jgi:hypothetical protein
MEYRLDIELITGWWSLGDFKLGYKHDVNRVIDETRKLIKNPESGYQTNEKLQECKLFLGRVKTSILQHEWGANCNDKEKQESIALIDSFVEEIEGLKSIWKNENVKANTTFIMPKELQTDKAKALFEKAIKLSLIERNGEFYNWIGGSKQLLAYFAERANNHLALKTKLDKDGNKTTNWKVFETVFNVSELKGRKNDWMKVNTIFTPNGHEKVDALFD